MAVCGRYTKRFAEASHVLFEGHLDSPSFRNVAIQEIKGLTGETVLLSDSGELAIETDKHGELVRIVYEEFFFGPTRTTGRPFKDDRTEAIGEPKVTPSRPPEKTTTENTESTEGE